MSDLVVSRRAVTRALSTLPIMALPAASLARQPASSRAEWDAAMQAYHRAVAEADAFSAEHDRLFAAGVAGTHDDPDLHERNERIDALCEAEVAAESVLLAMPAPDGEAVLWKMDRLFGPEVCGPVDEIPCYSLDYVRPFFDDIRRLAGEDRA